MPRRNILVVLSYFNPYLSGVSEYARLLVEGLAADHEVVVLTGRHKPELPEHEVVDGYTIERAKPFAFLHKGYLSVDLARRYRRLAAHADIINFHLPMLDAAWLTGLTPRGKPIVATYQCDIQPTGGILDRLAVAAVNLSSRICLKRSAQIIVLSEDYALGSPTLQRFRERWLEGFAPIKISSLPGGREAANSPPCFRIGFLGRFVEEKGIGVLVGAAELVLKRLPHAKLILAGEYRDVAGGSIYEQLRPRLEGLGTRVELLGRLDEEKLPAFYRSLDVFVLPSVNAYEAFGMVQVEAMLQGTPVVASDMRGVRVPVTLTGNGRLVGPKNSEALADAILAFASGAVDRDAVAARARAVFSNEAFLARYEEAMERSLSKASSTKIDASP